MMLENPADSGKYSEKWWIEKACDWNVYVMKGNWRDLIPNIKE